MFIISFSLTAVITESIAQTDSESEAFISSDFSPFVNDFEFPTGFKPGSDAMNKFNVVAQSDGIRKDPNIAIAGPKDGLFFVLWQEFKPSTGFNAGGLLLNLPTYDGIKKSDVKGSLGTTVSDESIEYAVMKAVGNGDGLQYISKGKIKTVGYLIHLPIQYRTPNNDLKSGMFTVIYRGSENDSKRIKIDSFLTNFMASLTLKEGYKRVSLESYKNEFAKAKLRQEIEAELAKSTSKDGKTESSPSIQPKSTMPTIKEIYMVDADANCYKFSDNAGMKQIECPNLKK